MGERLAPNEGMSRRSALVGAAWSIPVIAAAIATPLAAASTIIVGDFRLDGSCGTPDTLGPGFTLTAGTVDLPAGTAIMVSGSGVANVGEFTVTGGTATITEGSPTSRAILLTSPLPATGALEARTTLATSTPFALSGGIILPAGYSAGAGAKSLGRVNVSITAICTAT